jgi:hypothetical protein
MIVFFLRPINDGTHCLEGKKLFRWATPPVVAVSERRSVRRNENMGTVEFNKNCLIKVSRLRRSSDIKKFLQSHPPITETFRFCFFSLFVEHASTLN